MSNGKRRRLARPCNGMCARSNSTATPRRSRLRPTPSGRTLVVASTMARVLTTIRSIRAQRPCPRPCRRAIELLCSRPPQRPHRTHRQSIATQFSAWTRAARATRCFVSRSALSTALGMCCCNHVLLYPSQCSFPHRSNVPFARGNPCNTTCIAAQLIFGSVAIDEARAIALYTRAADRGHAHAIVNLGVCFQVQHARSEESIQTANQWQISEQSLHFSTDTRSLFGLSILDTLTLFHLFQEYCENIVSTHFVRLSLSLIVAHLT